MRLCCLDCNMKEEVEDGSAFKRPEDPEKARKNTRIKTIVILIVITVLIVSVTFLAYKRFFTKVNYFENIRIVSLHIFSLFDRRKP